MKPATNAPVFCAVYPELAEFFRGHGYALAIHGSMARDFDLIAVPWTPTAACPSEVVVDLVAKFAFETHGTPEMKEHGRIVCSFLGSHGWLGHLDISFLPRIEK